MDFGENGRIVMLSRVELRGKELGTVLGTLNLPSLIQLLPDENVSEIIRWPVKVIAKIVIMVPSLLQLVRTARREWTTTKRLLNVWILVQPMN